VTQGAQRGTSRNTGSAEKLTGPNQQGGATRVGSQATNRAGQAAAERNAVNLSKDRSPQVRQAVADRKEYWNRWTKDNQTRLQRFQAARDPQWKQIANWRQGKNLAQGFHSDSWRAYRDNVINFRNERRVEIWNGVQFFHDGLFDNRWWAGCGWYPAVAVGFWDPWWWWTPCDWPAFSLYLGWGPVAPVDFDYGVNAFDDGQFAYYDGAPIGSTADYADQAVRLANPKDPPPPPTPPGQDQTGDWKPLGVWALTQEEKGDAFMFLQLSVNKAGVISGAYANVLSGEKEPVVGQIDKATQRAAFRIGNTQGAGNTQVAGNPKEQTVIEAGAYNLTQDVASCFVRFGTGKAQTWLMVRLPGPAMPNAPTPIGEQPNSTENHS
jgi:hypothetical protein